MTKLRSIKHVIRMRGLAGALHYALSVYIPRLALGERYSDRQKSSFISAQLRAKLAPLYDRHRAALQDARHRIPSTPVLMHGAESDPFNPADLEHRASLLASIQALHRRGVTGLSSIVCSARWDPAQQMVILPEDDPSLCWHSSTATIEFRRLWDEDREDLGRYLHSPLMTFASAKRELKSAKSKVSHWYAPINFGFGLTIGGHWAVENGTGRWEILNSSVLEPLLKNARVIDLGANNGINALMMLRLGASSVLGYELSPAYVESAATVRRLAEWIDMVEQYDLRIQIGDMRDVLTVPPGQADVITAFCSLYYLPAKDIHQVLTHARNIAPVMIVQANDNKQIRLPGIDPESASALYLRRCMEDVGFSVETHSMSGFGRPLLVGRVET